ncbi:retrovirus-related pol polyprotein from transposon TNT 1-94 [Tanacetum coccineum]
MYDSWKTRILLYIEGKENGEMLVDSIKEGPFQLKEEITIPTIEGSLEIKCPQTLEDLIPKELLRKSYDIKATNILLLGLPVNIYTLLEWNRFVTTAKQAKDLHNVNFDQFQATRTRVINTVGDVNANQPRLIKCYSCKGEGYIAKQCTTKRRAKDSECFKEKMLLAQAHESRVVLHEEQQDFLADRLEEMEEYDNLQLHTT